MLGPGQDCQFWFPAYFADHTRLVVKTCTHRSGGQNGTLGKWHGRWFYKLGVIPDPSNAGMRGYVDHNLGWCFLQAKLQKKRKKIYHAFHSHNTNRGCRHRNGNKRRWSKTSLSQRQVQKQTGVKVKREVARGWNPDDHMACSQRGERWAVAHSGVCVVFHPAFIQSLLQNIPQWNETHQNARPRPRRLQHLRFLSKWAQWMRVPGEPIMHSLLQDTAWQALSPHTLKPDNCAILPGYYSRG